MDKACEKIEACEECCEDDALDAGAEQGHAFGVRPASVPAEDGKSSVYANERFAGTFKRVISLPDDADPSRIEARYRNGVLRVTIARRESAQPRRIQVQ